MLSHTLSLSNVICYHNQHQLHTSSIIIQTTYKYTLTTGSCSCQFFIVQRHNETIYPINPSLLYQLLHLSNINFISIGLNSSVAHQSIIILINLIPTTSINNRNSQSIKPSVLRTIPINRHIAPSSSFCSHSQPSKHVNHRNQ